MNVQTFYRQYRCVEKRFFRCDITCTSSKIRSSPKFLPMQAASAEVARLKALLDQAYKNASAQAKRLDEAVKGLEAANSEALTAKQQTASLQMDLASAADKQHSAADLANSRLEAAIQRQHALEEELKWLEQSGKEVR